MNLRNGNGYESGKEFVYKHNGPFNLKFKINLKKLIVLSYTQTIISVKT